MAKVRGSGTGGGKKKKDYKPRPATDTSAPAPERKRRGGEGHVSKSVTPAGVYKSASSAAMGALGTASEAPKRAYGAAQSAVKKVASAADKNNRNTVSGIINAYEQNILNPTVGGQPQSPKSGLRGGTASEAKEVRAAVTAQEKPYTQSLPVGGRDKAASVPKPERRTPNDRARTANSAPASTPGTQGRGGASTSPTKPPAKPPAKPQSTYKPSAITKKNVKKVSSDYSSVSKTAHTAIDGKTMSKAEIKKIKQARIDLNKMRQDIAGKQGYGKTEKKTITDKKGRKRTVWIGRGIKKALKKGVKADAVPPQK